eukprot:gene6941-64088_t
MSMRLGLVMPQGGPSAAACCRSVVPHFTHFSGCTGAGAGGGGVIVV